MRLAITALMLLSITSIADARCCRVRAKCVTVKKCCAERTACKCVTKCRCKTCGCK